MAEIKSVRIKDCEEVKEKERSMKTREGNKARKEGSSVPGWSFGLICCALLVRSFARSHSLSA